MNDPHYEYSILEEAHRFDFVSIGKERIEKSILYRQTEVPDVVTLTLATILPDGSFDYYSISNNGDRDAILATVIQSIALFFVFYPDKIVAFTGSNETRTRLYRMVISRELDSLEEMYRIQGVTAFGIEDFSSEVDYGGFLISLKKANIV